MLTTFVFSTLCIREFQIVSGAYFLYVLDTSFRHCSGIVLKFEIENKEMIKNKKRNRKLRLKRYAKYIRVIKKIIIYRRQFLKKKKVVEFLLVRGFSLHFRAMLYTKQTHSEIAQNSKSVAQIHLGMYLSH